VVAERGRKWEGRERERGGDGLAPKPKKSNFAHDDDINRTEGTERKMQDWKM